MLTPNTVLQNRYRIERLVGKGGMGAVYEATDLTFGSKIAIKETLVSSAQINRTFENEARLLNKLRHPALARVSNFFSENHASYLVMDYIPGDDLHTVLENRKLNIEPKGQPKPFEISDVVSWAFQLLDALDYLHSYDPPILHRDIKPLNLKLVGDGQLILLDFGLAKQSTSIYGYTLGYSSFEQTMNTGTDFRSDLYSVAATLYYLFTGVEPTDILVRSAELLSKRSEPLRFASEINPQIPQAVAELLMRAMSIDREARFQNVAEMRHFLAEASRATDTEKVINSAARSRDNIYSETVLAGVPPQQAASTHHNANNTPITDMQDKQKKKDGVNIKIKNSEIGQLIHQEGSHNSNTGPSYDTPRKSNRSGRRKK